MITETFVPALGIRAPPEIYEAVVDLFCRDDFVKQQLLARVAAAHTDVGGVPLHIVDVACGPGKLVRMLAEQQSCCSITALDIDREMVERASTATATQSNVIVKQANVCALPFGDATCDIAIESLLFHHLNDEQKATATREIARVLKPDGVFYFVDWVKPVSVWSQIAFNVVKWLDGVENVAAHADNRVLQTIELEFSPQEPPKLIETTVGTLAIIVYKKKLAVDPAPV